MKSMSEQTNARYEHNYISEITWQMVIATTERGGVKVWAAPEKALGRRDGFTRFLKLREWSERK